MNIFKKIVARKRTFILGGAILVILIALGIMIFAGGNSTTQTMTVERGDFVNEISVSGKVIAAESAELGFDQSGRIAGIYAKVGDQVKAGTVIANIENGAARADAAQKLATLQKEQAKLASLQKGTRPEQLAIADESYKDASSALVIAMRNAYLETESALLNKVDMLFRNGNGVNPDIRIRTSGIDEERAIESERVTVSEKLASWISALNGLGSSPPDAALVSVRAVGTDALSATKGFLDDMSAIVNDLSTGNSGLTQTEIDEDRETVNTAAQQVSDAAKGEQDAYGVWSAARSQLALDRSGSTAEDIAAQTAQVRSVEADLASAQARLRATLVIAPFDGIVTKLDAKIGEIVSPSSAAIALMSVGAFEIESYIPEINIAGVKVGDPAVVTLDAYGDDVSFDASVISVDPAETLKDGVSTYKTRLVFAVNDPRIKSGMTANIRITTDRKPGTIVIPRGVIIERNGKRFVTIKTGDEERLTEIVTGSATRLGQIEVISGLSDGDIIIVPSPSTPAAR